MQNVDNSCQEKVTNTCCNSNFGLVIVVVLYILLVIILNSFVAY